MRAFGVHSERVSIGTPSLSSPAIGGGQIDLPSPACEAGRSHVARRLSAPSPRLPSGRLRPSSTGYGEGRGEGAYPHAQTRGDAPSPGIFAKSTQIPTSPRTRGEVKAVPCA